MPKNLTIYAPGKIDIPNSVKIAETAKKSIEQADISPRNKELILNFLRDCEWGKTVKKKAKKRIAPHRIAKYAFLFKRIAYWMAKDFDKITQKDMEDFIIKLENDTYRKSGGQPLKHNTKLDYKKAIRKFYKWLYGNNEVIPDVVSWIDTSNEHQEIPAISFDEVKNLVNKRMFTVHQLYALLFQFTESTAHQQFPRYLDLSDHDSSTSLSRKM